MKRSVLNIRWRRRLFGFHLLMWLAARLAVGSINQTPPAAIYNLLDIWALVVAIHGVLLVIVDGRDRAELPIRQLNRLIEPRERRWSLLAIDAHGVDHGDGGDCQPRDPRKSNFPVCRAAVAGMAGADSGRDGTSRTGSVRRNPRASGKRQAQKERDRVEGGERLLLTSDGELLQTIDEPHDSDSRSIPQQTELSEVKTMSEERFTKWQANESPAQPALDAVGA